MDREAFLTPEARRVFSLSRYLHTAIGRRFVNPRTASAFAVAARVERV
jgi:hypothetical protein